LTVDDFSSQVLVIGGGPGGSTTAALLARQGFSVTLLERQKFPRYHIGESLLPSCLRVLDELGVREKVEAHGFQHKHGALFDWSGERWSFEFGSETTPLYAFQVIRSEFDALLLEHAASQGVDVREHVEVTNIDFADGRPQSARFVDAQGKKGRGSFEVLVDASGRAGLLTTRYLDNRRFHEVFRNVALWGYWRNALRLADSPQGATASCSIPHGWVWAIPLHDGTLSVGTVMHKSHMKMLRDHSSLEEIYREAVASNPVILGLVESGDLIGTLRVETDYSYAADQFSGPGYYLVGDAACFLDPLLSTGVHLATFSGLVAAASIASVLRGDVSEADAIDFFGASYRRAYLRMLVMVSAFYKMHTGRDTFFRQAQELTASDYEQGDLIGAFVNVVSGVEDLKDMGEVSSHDLLDSLMALYAQHYEFVRDWKRGDGLSLYEIKQGITRTKIVEAVPEEFSLTPETAVNGLYVATGSNLGLRPAVYAHASPGRT
jgi:flavin-dependent dehydrogenase